MRAIAIPRVTPGLPSELLAQRPDIRQAEAQSRRRQCQCVQRARADAAERSRSPAKAATRAPCSRRCCGRSRRSTRSTAGLTQPIFDGGRLQGNLDLQKGVQDQLLQNYRKAVISAFTDVENALIAMRQTAQSRAPATRRGHKLAPGLRSFRAAVARGHRRIWSPCCRPSRRCSRPRTRWRRRGSRGCRRSSAFIKRSAAAGCRNRWKPPMHGKVPKQIWAKTKGRTRRNLAIWSSSSSWSPPRLSTSSPARRRRSNRSRFGAEGGPVPVLVSRRDQEPTCRSISTPSAPSRRSTP